MKPTRFSGWVVHNGNCRNKKDYIKKTRFALIDPDGNLHRGIELVEFCKKYDLDTSTIRKILVGKRISHKGWKRANEWYVNNKIQVKSHSIC